MNKSSLIAAAIAAAALATLTYAEAQVAGSTAVSLTITEASELAMGWSAKKSILGKTVFNENGDKVGKIDDLIISPDRNVSYAIVGAGGFIGMGRHDVAIPMANLQQQGSKIVLAGATKESIKAMPSFDYATDTARRDEFVAKAERDIIKAKARLAELQRQSAAASAEVKPKVDVQIVTLQNDVTAVEASLTKMKEASAARWKETQGELAAATARLRKSFETVAS